MGIKKGDRVTVEGRIYGATVVKVIKGNGDFRESMIKVTYRDPNGFRVTRNVYPGYVRKEG